jgi:hypothetical protein
VIPPKAKEGKNFHIFSYFKCIFCISDEQTVPHDHFFQGKKYSIPILIAPPHSPALVPFFPFSIFLS